MAELSAGHARRADSARLGPAARLGATGRAVTVREVADLNYRELLSGALAQDELLGELNGPKLKYNPTVTREPFQTAGRITDLIASGQLFRDLGLPPFDKAEDRVMLCGGPSVLADLKQQLLDLGYEEGSISSPGDIVLEPAFVTTRATCQPR